LVSTQQWKGLGRVFYLGPTPPTLNKLVSNLLFLGKVFKGNRSLKKALSQFLTSLKVVRQDHLSRITTPA